MLARVGGDVELLREIAALFLESYPRLLAEIRRAIALSHSANLTRAAHTVKGAVSSFAAHTAFEAARRLEFMGRNGDLTHFDGRDRAERTYAELEEAIRCLMPAVAAIVKETVIS
jgi:HPt (histidine-containing phosphotransfer) domain-containing protein